MVDLTRMASPSTMFSAYASLSATIMLIQTTFYQLVPRPVRDYILNFIKTYFQKSQNRPEIFRLIIEETDGISINEIYSAAEVYLCSKTDANLYCLKISKRPKETGIQVRFGESEKIMDFYQGVDVTWRFNREEKKNPGSSRVMVGENDEPVDSQQKRSFEMSFNKEHKDTVLNSYIPFVLKRSKDIKHMKNVVKLHTLKGHDGYGGRGSWKSIILKHPTTFENLAMEKSLKQTITDDLDRFLMRKEFYKKVGKAWKRGYLLYGPPGTGKSSLVAAIANYLKFDIYDLELASIHKDSDLRGLLLATPNRSIIVIEDIDCTVELPDRYGDGHGSHGHGPPHPYHYMQQKKFTLSGLLNFIDGLWSSCADERIIIFTTNNKDKLDPALLRPGRMDMHISMSYLTIDGFKQLLSTYLNIDYEHGYGHGNENVNELIREIEGLIGSKNVTPAEVAGELMLSDDAEVSLMGLLKFLQQRKDEEPQVMADDEKSKVDDGSQVKIVDDDDNGIDLDDDSDDEDLMI